MSFVPRPFSTAPEQYSKTGEANFRRAVQQGFETVFHRGQDVELLNGERLLLRSPDGSQFEITVANDGTLSATAL